MGVTIFFVLRDIGERTQGAALDAELANSERLADALSSRFVALQTSMRSAATKLPVNDLGNTDALIGYSEQNSQDGTIECGLGCLEYSPEIDQIWGKHGIQSYLSKGGVNSVLGLLGPG